MGRAQGHKTRDRNKSSLPQVPKNMKYDRMSEEYAQELNNQISREEQALSNAANQRNQGNKG
ncbi:YfhD family protein [Bacillus tuaregi]|uniref:YfhD family protein n=1 Tax=Bacillus tuaregi TaxID=1816695 RepID=UPI0008F886E5|nr:YfhD family protein [Bacillus tuaregi]